MYIYVYACIGRNFHLTFINAKNLFFTKNTATFANVIKKNNISMEQKFKYLTRGKIFGYSIWNTTDRPLYDKQLGIFKNKNYPYSADEECYVSGDLIPILFGEHFKLEEGECVNFYSDISIHFK